ncbi:hypothetical protein ACPXAZ_26080, partial [Escherichia coli]|uniref:hypothetical protein n=1 Tax=Escherichia coli TaxID=562 RepID=UPI003CE46F53
HALFVAGQTAAVLRRHIVRFLADHVETVVQCAALRGRVIDLVDVSVNATAQVVDAAIDLMEALIGNLLRVGARR